MSEAAAAPAKAAAEAPAAAGEAAAEAAGKAGPKDGAGKQPNGGKKGPHGKNKRERKPREVDNSPAEVDAQGNLVHVSRPDGDKKELVTSKLTKQIEVLLAKRNAMSSEREAAKGSNKPFLDKRNALLAKVKVERAGRKKHLDQAEAIKNKVDKIIKTAEARRAKEKKAKDELKFDSVAQVDKKIDQLEHRHETQALGKDAEKALMKEITALRAVRRRVDAFVKEQEDAKNSAGGEDVPTLRAQIRSCYDAANVHKAAADEISAELDKLNSANKAVAGKQDKLFEAGRALQKEIDALFEEREEVNAAFNKEWTRYKKYMTALNKQRDAERKEREVAWKAEKAEMDRLAEEEEMKKKPWEAEIALCDMLTTYLENLVGIKRAAPADDAATDAAADADDTPEARAGGSTDAFSGMTAVGKKHGAAEENFMMMGAAGGKKKKKAAKKDKKIVHPLELLQSFAMLKLKAPGKLDEVAAAIKEVADKRAYYDVLPRAPRKSKAAGASDSAADGGEPKPKAAAAAAADDGKKKKSKPQKVSVPSVDSSDAFPTLPGSKSPTKAPVSPLSGPSASDRVKSSPPASP